MAANLIASDSLRNRLGVDVRSLAAGRIALAALLLVDLTIRWRELTPFLAPDAMFSLEQWRAVTEGTWLWSLYGWSDSPSFPALLLSLHCAAAALMLAGCFTRSSTIACWVLTASLHMRNPLVNNSGDTLLRMMLFWGMFADWGRCWSVDQWLRRRRQTEPPPRRAAAGWPASMLLIQLLLMYLITGWLKVNAVWLQGEAMERIVQMDYVVRPWGLALRDHPEVLRWITLATPFIELAPLLALCPWRTSMWRTLLAFFFIAFHAGIELTIHVGMFGLVSQACWLFFLPGAFWDRLGRAPRRPTGASDDQAPDNRVAPALWRRAAWRGLQAFAAVAAVFSAATALYVNLQANRLDPPVASENIDASSRAAFEGLHRIHPVVPLPPWVERPSELLATSQDWTMFRNPPLTCTWPVARAEMADGREMDLLRGVPWTEDGARERAADLPSQHWRYYFRRLTFAQHHFLADSAAAYLLRQWNRRRPQDPAVRVRLFFFERTLGAGGVNKYVLGAAGEAAVASPELDNMLQQLDAALDLAP